MNPCMYIPVDQQAQIVASLICVCALHWWSSSFCLLGILVFYFLRHVFFAVQSTTNWRAGGSFSYNSASKWVDDSGIVHKMHSCCQSDEQRKACYINGDHGIGPPGFRGLWFDMYGLNHRFWRLPCEDIDYSIRVNWDGVPATCFLYEHICKVADRITSAQQNFLIGLLTSRGLFANRCQN